MIEDTDGHKPPVKAGTHDTGSPQGVVHAPQCRGDRGVFFAAVRMSPLPMCLSDPNQPDNPLVFVNRAFEDLTGYTEEDVLGRNCRFLQGPDTDLAVVAEVRRSITARVDVSTELYNYRKDGHGFWSALYLSPVFGDAGELLYFFASQLDVTRQRETEAMVVQSRHQIAQLARAGWGVNQAQQDLQRTLSLAHGRFDALRLSGFGELIQDQRESGPRDGSGPKEWEAAAWKTSNGNARPRPPATPSYAGCPDIVLRCVRIDTQSDDEEACLVFSDQWLVALLVRLSGQHGALRGQWHLEYGFGMLDGLGHPCFVDLVAAREWARQQLGQAKIGSQSGL